MNKKVLWISLASVATLGVAGFFIWRAVKKKRANKELEEATYDTDYREIEGGGEVEAQEQPQQQPQQAQQQQPQTPPHVDIEENLVYLSAKWCPACQQNKETAEKLFKKYEDKVEFIMLDADDEDAQSYGFQLEIRHIPTLAFVSEGKKIDELVGPQTMEQYEEKMAKYFPDLFKKKAKMVTNPPAQEPAPKKAVAPLPQAPQPAQNGKKEDDVEVAEIIESSDD